MGELKLDTDYWARISNSGPVSIISYCGSSILMTLTNKYVVNRHDFNMNFFVLFVQAAVCSLALVLLRSLGHVKFRTLNKMDVKNWIPISLLLVLMIYTSSKSLQYLAVPIYTIFKNLTIILIAYGEVLFFGGFVTRMELTSFVLMVLSSILATIGDLQDISEKIQIAGYTNNFQFNMGYLWMLANCISSALFVLTMRKRIKLTNFKDFDTMFYNNILAMPILLTASLLVEDWSVTNISTNLSKDSWTAMVISGLASVGISYCSGWCVRVTSSTTYSMVGALNKLPIALSGLMFFNASKNFMSITSILMGFIAGIVYTVSKQQKQKQLNK